MSTRTPPDLRVAEVAARQQVSPKTVARWIKEGRVKHRRTLGGSVGRGHARIEEEEVQRLEAEMARRGQVESAQP